MAKMQKKNLNSPDETRPFSKGKVELVTVEGITLVEPLLSLDGSGLSMSSQ